MAFDRVYHTKLFNKLLERGLPGRIIWVLIDWYGKLFCMVKWNGSFSSWFCVKSGVRQGGILSPFVQHLHWFSYIFFEIRPIWLRLSLKGRICWMHCLCWWYSFLSASVTNLQKMLNICCEQADHLDIQFNHKKSCLFNIGKGYKDRIQNLFLKDKEVVWLDRIRYLGVYFVTNKQSPTGM